ncbi:MAG: hypothetical protein HOQ02_05765 [Lysobacter sp.]|nr:hypothetical protein [Lysobacter sp.]
MPLTRNALDELLDTLQEQLAQRLANGEGRTELAVWFERCVQVIAGFAGPADHGYVRMRVVACRARMPVPGDLQRAM